MNEATAPAKTPAKTPILVPGSQTTRFRFLEERTSLTERIRHNHRAVTFLGALVLLGAFLMKEGVLENVKETEAGLDKAETFMLIREDIAHYTEIESELLIGRHPEKPETRFRFLLFKTDMIGKEQSALLDLIHKLPEEYQSELWKKIKRWEEQDPMPIFDVEHRETVLKNIKRLEREMQSAKVMEDSAVFDAVLTVRLAIYDQEKKLHLATSLSYVLYVLGSIIGLAGRILGVDVGGDE